MVYWLFQKTRFLAERAFLDEGVDMFSHERQCVTSVLKLLHCGSNTEMTDICVVVSGYALEYVFGQMRGHRGVF